MSYRSCVSRETRTYGAKYVVACDFGQTYDYSTVAVTERVLEEVGKPYEHTTRAVDGSRRREVRQDLEGHYRLVRLDRVPLRTPYTTICRQFVPSDSLKGRGNCP